MLIIYALVGATPEVSGASDVDLLFCLSGARAIFFRAHKRMWGVSFWQFRVQYVQNVSCERRELGSLCVLKLIV